MLLARFVLIASALVFATVGLAFLVHPVETASLVAIELSRPVATSDVRAVYGGLELAIAFVLVYAARNASLVRPGLGLQVCLLAGLVLGRIVSLFADGVPERPGLTLLGFEMSGLLLGIVALSRLQVAPGGAARAGQI